MSQKKPWNESPKERRAREAKERLALSRFCPCGHLHTENGYAHCKEQHAEGWVS